MPYEVTPVLHHISSLFKEIFTLVAYSTHWSHQSCKEYSHWGHSGSILKYSTHRFHNICSSELQGIFTLEALCSATRASSGQAKALDLVGPAKY